ncbi:MAG TPA: bifunctional diaminohydroxyphosphoribosylaminopyrimidine deaminase/5-amino-6-(5-phosphoribosylamino)uracil reductase RibD [Gemmatimonadales bacterium]|nr:bifunctional diaminohydroxyphosphoribosylaminopyrimidine deaminase/5-amino-6-(5-phosphoribosylamino)uracil reductase RibD [Gemmatimonadales bacterium]
MDYMERALELARRAQGWCSPNPAVGAVVVRDGEIVGEGWTQPVGQAHAEVVALRAAGDRARGAALYVTLEPCSHFGRTPPCTDAILAAGVAEVHAATLDPSPWVNGKGAEILRAAGVPVLVGAHEAEARKLNEGYFTWVRTGRPFVTLKFAMTVDGKIATRTGASFWITGSEARRYVARLRASVDAVMVGIGTVLADDPQLTARPGEWGDAALEPAHQPLRVVLDTTGRLPVTARLVSGGLPGTTLVCTTERASVARLRELESYGVETLVLPEGDGGVDVVAALQALGKRGVTSVLAECGGTLAWSLLQRRVVDAVLAFVAPKIVGGRTAPTPVGGEGLARMDQAMELVDPRWEVCGRDVMLSAYVRRCEPSAGGPVGAGGA